MTENQIGLLLGLLGRVEPLDDAVRLVGHTTERWIPVRVTAVPETPRDYYQGVIEAQLVPNSKFQAGNGVRFGEDQVMAN